MKIKEMYIDGFGHFHDYTLRDLPPGLLIVKGPNEAGKSTLLAFIRRMLFGKPPGRSFNPYEPLNGGEHGGRLTVETDAGIRYDIARQGKLDQYTIRNENGSPVTRGIELITGSADRDFYENVFAFGLEELYRFETLSEESVQNHVTGAGVGIKTCSIPVLQKTIKDEIQDIYKPGARSRPWFMKTLKEITGTEKEIHALSKTQARYDGHQRDRRAGQEELSRLKGLRADIRHDLESRKRIAGIWEDWTTYQDKRNRLTGLPLVDAFPENGTHLLDSINERVQEREDARAGKERELGNLRIDRSAISLNTAVLEHESAIRSLERGLEKYLSDLSARNTLTDELSRSGEDYQRNLASLNPDWDDSTLLSFDSSPEAQSRVSGFRKDFSRYEEDLRILTNEAEQIRKERDAVVPQLRFIEDALEMSGDLPSPEILEREKKAIEELYTEVPDLDRRKAELEGILKEEAAAGERWKEVNAALTGTMPLWPAGLMVAAGLLSLGLGAMGDSLLIGVGVMVLFVIAAGVYWSAVKKHESRQRGAANSDSSGEAGSAVLEWADVRQKKEDEVRKFEGRLTGLAKTGGFSTIPSAASLNSRRSELERLSKRISEREIQESDRRKLETELAGRKSQLDAKLSGIADTKEALSILTAEWQKWLRDVSLPEGMLPDIAAGLFPKTEQLVALLYSNQKSAERLKVLTNSVAEYESGVSSLVQNSGLLTCGSTEGDLEYLVSCLGENLSNQRMVQDMDLSCRKLENEILGLTEEQDRLLAQKTALFAKAFAKDEEQFREYGRVWGERRDLMQSCETCKNAIARAAGKGTSYEEFTAQLETLDYAEVCGAITDLEDQLKVVDADIEDVTTSLGRISESLAQLEREDESACLESERLLLCEELNDHSREWAKRVIAGHILGKAVERYEKERQPAVIREATEIFSGISDGRYRRIIKPLDADGVLVEEAAGGRKAVGQLSRGTAEQLYLALRFGYITEFGKHDVPLPVVFDDILVNFDPVRKEKSCQAIAGLAEKNQVFYFTCHPETAEMLKRCCGNARVIDLEQAAAE